MLGALTIQRLLLKMREVEASDLHIKVHAPPVLRIGGHLHAVDAPALDANDTQQLLDKIIPDHLRDALRNKGGIDFAHHEGEGARFRCSVFHAGNGLHAAIRRVNPKIPSFEQLHLPKAMAEVCMQPQGIVLMCGVTGSGKSTTIASMLQYINERKPVHIVTIEDPIEYIFKDSKAFVNQREVGIDCLDFNDALRALVRENPDVVLIGEMRDKETFEAAIRAAETGHLVFGTIHASSAWQSFGRIYDLFNPEEREQIRKLLAYNLRAIVYQKLLPTLHENIARIPAIEILLNNAPARKYILEGREGELLDIIRSNRDAGMIDFTSSLVQLVEQEYIHYKVAMEATPNPEELSMRLKGIS